jgi:hypothetical protein
VGTGTVRSPDGTTIGFRQTGKGLDVVLLHGGMTASRHLTELGQGLSDAFTVYRARPAGGVG